MKAWPSNANQYLVYQRTPDGYHLMAEVETEAEAIVRAEAIANSVGHETFVIRNHVRVGECVPAARYMWRPA